MTHGDPGAAARPGPSSEGARAVTALVDTTTGAVVAADGAQAAPGTPLTAWALAQGLSDPAGAALDDPSGPLARAARGEAVAAELLRVPASPAGAAAVRVLVTAVRLGSLPLDVRGPGLVPGAPHVPDVPAGAAALVALVDLPASPAHAVPGGGAREHPAAPPGGVRDVDVWALDLPGAGSGRAWHDVLALGGGTLGLVVGEVAGGGAGADAGADAAVAEVRSVVRAYADGVTEPGTVVMRVDQLVGGARIRRAASMVLGRLDPLDDGAWEWSWTCAGDLPPLLVRSGRDGAGAGAGVDVLADGPDGVDGGLDGGAGRPVGASGEPRPTGVAVLAPGDVLVLWAGGLAERDGRAPAAARALLERVCADLAPADAAGVGEQLLEHLGDAPQRAAALVVVRVPEVEDQVVLEPAGTPRRRRWQLPGEPSSIARARRHVMATCAAWDLPVAPEAGLVVSELVGNAVLHGWGQVALRVRHTGRGLVVEVDDANPGAPREDPAPSASGGSGYGLRVVGRLAEWGWRRSGPGKTVWALLPATPGREG